MATTKISATKSTSRAINYAEKRAEEKSGLNCDIDYAKSAFKASREVYGKTDGNQGHVIIQSFKPREVTPEQCNTLGLELAEKIAPNHQVAIYTHSDTDHIHNHIVINAINLETGKKFNNNKQALKDVRQANDEVCRNHGLSIPNDQAEIRYTQAEQNLIDKGKSSWKNDIRLAIDETQATDMENFQEQLRPKGIIVERVTDKTITYRHMGADKKVRGSKLGDIYDKGGITHGFEAEKQRRRKYESKSTTPERTPKDQSTHRQPGTTLNWSSFDQSTQALFNERKRRERAERAEREAREQDDRARAERAKQIESESTISKRTKGFDLEL
ncbi:protein rlx [Staphylococcus xylosus]|uniref:relaxase/mobilization nuclease domain-containing protein n=1 Tax=Staphylococcus xylosus TaxID=1288 RepID=UPI00107266BD|nr:relaxase/mobilization nuclease domain-containing protein [Staphylococcus xylosus]MBF0811963.1 relaxase/mobilization nuclease domain-containing protein [Staphylococcus xylosus]TFV19957.1 protein rlx [Staphylococcus xylosus]